MERFVVAVVGALGAVGQEMLKTLEQRDFPISKVKPLDIAKNVGKEIIFNGKVVKVEEAREGAFMDVDLALFSAGGDASLELAPIAVQEGAIVIDNSSAWRMDDNCPLVIPEVNPETLKSHKGIIANPNCSTIQMVVVLKPLHDLYKIKRVVVSTYQAVSGAGQKGINALSSESRQSLDNQVVQPSAFKYQIAFNAIPQIDIFLDNGYTKEEMKMVHETHKILDPNIKVCPTAVRIPVYKGHSESIAIEVEKTVDIDQARKALKDAEGILVVDDPSTATYPTPIDSEVKD
jgi:aspartate-semialdehyde dehydrogenase